MNIDKLNIASKVLGFSVCEHPDGIYTWDGWEKNSTKLSSDQMALVDAEYARQITQYPLDQCKEEAKKRIAACDWSVLPDVGLANVAAFETYRAALRELIKNPVAEPVWPTEPTPIWS